jgi:acetyl-CoA C-acetyltransferase
MDEIIIAGIGQTPVAEHWDLSLRSLAVKAARTAIADSGGLQPQALYVGNLLASTLSRQANLGTLVADQLALSGIEAVSVEAAGASGAAALRMGFLAVLSGAVDRALVVGVEKCTDVPSAALENAISEATDNDYEGAQGLTQTAQAALLMQRYLHDNNAPADALSGFPLLAHENGVTNPNAFFQKALKPENYTRAPQVSPPLSLLDAAPYADGAAAVLLTRRSSLLEAHNAPLVRLTASSIAIDALALHDRPDPLAFAAAARSAGQALTRAGHLPEDFDFFELTDAFSIYAALSLEACGFAPRGQGWRMAQSGALRRAGRLPISTFGGYKARGNPLSASGLYQVVEAVLQMRGAAGPNQVPDVRLALVQTLGGPASTAVTHVLELV